MSKKKARSQEVNETAVNETPTTELSTEATSTAIETSKTEPTITEQPKKPRRNARPYLEFATDALVKGLYTQKELVAAILAAYPEMTKSAIQTFVTDLKNIKYCYFKPRLVVVNSDGKMIFEDVVNAAEAEQTEEVTEVEPEATLVEETPLETEIEADA